MCQKGGVLTRDLGRPGNEALNPQRQKATESKIQMVGLRFIETEARRRFAGRRSGDNKGRRPPPLTPPHRTRKRMQHPTQTQDEDEHSREHTVETPR